MEAGDLRRRSVRPELYQEIAVGHLPLSTVRRHARRIGGFAFGTGTIDQPGHEHKSSGQEC